MSSTSGDKISGKRALSSATLNMRFMQRKSLNDSSLSGGDKQSFSVQTKGTTQFDRIQKTEENLPLVVSACSSDMFLDIIGRRSFNGFNKSTEANFNRALDSIKRERDEQRAAKDHISDEELLRRYEIYIKGKSDSMSH